MRLVITNQIIWNVDILVNQLAVVMRMPAESNAVIRHS
jgi:hypothetical protein